MWWRYCTYNSIFIAALLKDFVFPPEEKRAGMLQKENAGSEDDRVNVLGVGVTTTSMGDAVKQLVEARETGETGYVCVTGAHGIMESQRDEQLRGIHNQSLMTVPDGMPTVWMGHEYGFVKMGRVYGPDLMLRLMEATAYPAGVKCYDLGVKQEKSANADLTPNHLKLKTAEAAKPLTHFLYGATEETLCKLKANLEQRFPGIQIVGTYAPPFRPLTDEEESELQQVVAACKPDFFWVGLSTPKQERFMFEHCSNMNVGGEMSNVGSTVNSISHIPHPTGKFLLDAGIFIGVGAAFDIHAGNIKDTPKWIQNAGLQWLHRLCKEPRRLWRRYFWIVPGFLWLAFLQVMGLKKYSINE